MTGVNRDLYREDKIEDEIYWAKSARKRTLLFFRLKRAKQLTAKLSEIRKGFL